MKIKSLIALLSTSAFIASTALSTQVLAESNSNITKFKEAQKDKTKIETDIKDKDAKLNKFKENMKQAGEKINEIQKKIDPIEKNLRVKEASLKKSEDEYHALVSNMYEEGVFSPLAMILQSDNWSEFTANLNMVTTIADRRYELFNEIKTKRDEVKKAKDDLGTQINLQQKVIDESKKLFLEMVEAQKADKDALAKTNQILEEFEDEMIEENRELIASGKLKFPYVGPMQKPHNVTRSSPFGWREHPIFGGRRHHNGIDYPGPVGTPVYAPADGVVYSSKASRGYGWLLTIYHGEKNGVPIFTRYAHSYPYQIKVKVGENVTKGQQITSIGLNGNVDGAHLHFEVMKETSTFDNPENYY